ncbi:MAG TPA: ATP-grasp domain-containing protein [Methylomirabilota bacterium]|nr:ATP-grasp domain-containing protein [Methylomirabilota bacterium]
MPQEARPALILGGDFLWGLSMVRSLGRRGIPVYVTGTRGHFVSYSRWHRAAPAGWGAPPTPATLCDYLTALPQQDMVLIPPTDEWALAVAGLPAPLAARFPSSLPSPDTLDALIDKGRFATVLDELGVPHPRTVPVGPKDDRDRLPAEAFANAFLKPCDSQAFRRRFRVKAWHFKTPAEARARAAEAQEAGLEMMLQEYVPGPPTDHYMVEGFVDRTGRVCARFVRQRLRMHPPDFGDSTYMVSVPLERVQPAVESLDRLLAHLAFRGVFEAEFKYDARDGEFKLLEVNARPWSFIGFAALCGVDFAAMAYRDALGLPVVPQHEYPAGRYCIVGADRFACRALRREGQLGVAEWLRSWLGARQLLFAWDDPAPALARLLRHVWTAGIRRMNEPRRDPLRDLAAPRETR